MKVTAIVQDNEMDVDYRVIPYALIDADAPRFLCSRDLTKQLLASGASLNTVITTCLMAPSCA